MVRLVLPSGCQQPGHDCDIPPSTWAWKALLPWAALMCRALNGHSEKSAYSSDPSSLFTFPAIRRRVEKLDVLTPNGEERLVSLDLSTEIIQRIHDRTASHMLPPSLVTKLKTEQHLGFTDYAEATPLPFAYFDKGILIDFSATIGEQRLELEQKTTSMTAGYAWLLSSLQTPENLSDEMRHHLWTICSRRPPSKPDDIVSQIPSSWLIDQDEEYISEDLATQLDALVQHDVFYQRLRFLTVNYFGLLVIPPLDERTSGLVVKSSCVYGDSIDEWIVNQRTTRKKASFMKWLLFPPKAFRYRVSLHGCLEGHCEHLHIIAPKGTEFTTKYWVEKNDKFKPPEENTLAVFRQKDKLSNQVRLEDEQFKIFPQLISLRRHTPFMTPLRVYFGISADLSGIFTPAMIALVLLGALSVLCWASYAPWMTTMFLHNMAGFTTYVPWIASFVVAAATITIQRDLEPTRALMLQPLMRKLHIALLGTGALTLVSSLGLPQLYYLPTVRGILWMLLTLALVWMLYTTVYLVAAQYFLWKSRRLLRSKGKQFLLGRTKDIHFIDWDPEE